MVEKQLLAQQGYTNILILEAEDGRQGIEIFDKESPEWVILDLLMPDIEGEAVLKYIREKDKDCFVAVLSSNSQKSVQQRVLEMGADLFIEKPGFNVLIRNDKNNSSFNTQMHHGKQGVCYTNNS